MIGMVLGYKSEKMWLELSGEATLALFQVVALVLFSAPHAVRMRLFTKLFRRLGLSTTGTRITHGST
jgi:hypothetical protein